MAQIVRGPVEIELQTLVTLPQGSIATELVPVPGMHDRLLVASRNGLIYSLQGNELLEQPLFLDMAQAGVPITTSGEGGLLGLAFHPDFAVQVAPGAGSVFTYTTEAGGDAVPDFTHPELAAGGGVFHSVIRQWTVSPDQPDVIDTEIPSRVLMRIDQPQANHNGGDIAFGPDEYLYIALGDGGGGNDNGGSPTDPSDGHTNPGEQTPPGNGQDITNVYGSILRIDPLGSNSANGQYGVPPDNPFVAGEGVDEIFAYGLRNPYRMSFDRQAGQLYVGDVGQSQREEVDVIVSGGNYGWVVKEGTRIHRPGFDTTGMIDPLAEYDHSEGNSVIGGFVYRGQQIPELVGKYVFGDLGQSRGRLFYLDPFDPEIHEFLLDADGQTINDPIWGFGEDAAGELYVLVQDRRILQIQRAEPWLQAGDANQDLQFDQLDLGLVSQAGKYLTGQAASWAQGDWNGAPGGEPGSPPSGDGIFDQQDVIAALRTGLYLTGPYAGVGAVPDVGVRVGLLSDPSYVAVAEPSTWVLAMAAVGVLWGATTVARDRSAPSTASVAARSPARHPARLDAMVRVAFPVQTAVLGRCTAVAATRPKSAACRMACSTSSTSNMGTQLRVVSWAICMARSLRSR